MNKVLIIAYDWPPSAAVGAVRAVKIATRLADHGWRPFVVTVKPKRYERTQPGWQEDNRVTALRTGTIPGFAGRYGALKERLGWDKKRDVDGQDSGTMSSTSEAPGTLSRQARLKRTVLSLLLTPDEFQGWLPFAVPRAVRALQSEGIHHVITTGPPFTAHLVGLIGKAMRKDIRWIADFRDPWAGNEQRPIAKEQVAERINGWLEGKVLAYADNVVTVTPALTEFYRKRYVNLGGDRFCTITNGIEYEEFEGLTKQSKIFTVSYIGSIEYERSPELILRAIADLCQRGLINRRDVKIRLIGKCGSIRGVNTHAVLARYDLSEVTEVHGIMPRRQALQAMVDSDVLLLLANAQPLQVPAKAYEYIASGAFILALTEEMSATADLLKRVGYAECLRHDDLEGAKRAIRLQYEKWKIDAGRSSHKIPRHAVDYDWSTLGRRYAEILEGKS